MISYVTLRYEQHPRGRIAFVAVDNQTKLNSLSSEVMGQFVERFQSLAAAPDLRAVVLTGAGEKAFVGGANIDEMARRAGPGAARGFLLDGEGGRHAVRDLRLPLIPAANGWC